VLGSSSRKLVLIADEDVRLRNALERILRLRGFEVVAVSGVQDAVDATLLHHPSAAVVDLRLAGGSGRDVVVAMPARVPVIMFSASPQESGELERLRPRTRLLAKPYSLVLLVEALQEMLDRAEQLKGGS
jgi:DNA-binding response OmpR family regulator